MLRYAELRRQGNRVESVSERKALLSGHAQTLEALLANLRETLSVLHDKVALYSDMEAALLAKAKRRTGKGNKHGKCNIRKRFKETCGS